MGSEGINCNLLISFKMVSGIPTFEEIFKSFQLSAKSVLQWVAPVEAAAAKVVMERMNVSVSRRNSASKMSQVLKNEKPALHEPRTEQVRHVLGASLTDHTYALKNGWIRKLFATSFTKETLLSLGSMRRDSYNWWLTIIRPSRRWRTKWMCRRRSRHSSIFRRWFWRPERFQGKSQTNSETGRILRYQAWPFSLCISLRCAHEDLFAWSTAGFGTAVCVIQSSW